MLTPLLNREERHTFQHEFYFPNGRTVAATVISCPHDTEQDTSYILQSLSNIHSKATLFIEQGSISQVDNLGNTLLRIASSDPDIAADFEKRKALMPYPFEEQEKLPFPVASNFHQSKGGKAVNMDLASNLSQQALEFGKANFPISMQMEIMLGGISNFIWSRQILTKIYRHLFPELDNGLVQWEANKVTAAHSNSFTSLERCKELKDYYYYLREQFMYETLLEQLQEGDVILAHPEHIRNLLNWDNKPKPERPKELLDDILTLKLGSEYPESQIVNYPVMRRIELKNRSVIVTLIVTDSESFPSIQGLDLQAGTLFTSTPHSDMTDCGRRFIYELAKNQSDISDAIFGKLRNSGWTILSPELDEFAAAKEASHWIKNGKKAVNISLHGNFSEEAIAFLWERDPQQCVEIVYKYLRDAFDKTTARQKVLSIILDDRMSTVQIEVACQLLDKAYEQDFKRQFQSEYERALNGEFVREMAEVMLKDGDVLAFNKDILKYFLNPALIEQVAKL